MRLIYLFVVLFFATTSVVESVLISALIGFKVGYALASRNRGGGFRRSRGHTRRWGRSIADESSTDNIELEQILLQASIDDKDDCVKNFVCQVNAKPNLSIPLETFAYEYFGNGIKQVTGTITGTSEGMALIDVLSPTVEFDLAAQIGRVGGESQCKTIYKRCPLPYSELVGLLEGRITPQIPIN